MTTSDCSIGTIDDAEFKALLHSEPLIKSGWHHNLVWLPPRPIGEYWKTVLYVWAKQHALVVEDVDELTIRVAVSRVQLLQFLDEVFWREEDAAFQREKEVLKHDKVVDRVERLRKHARECLRDDRTYLLEADEF